MKKPFIVAAIVAAVGISAYIGFRPDPTASLTELQLANAEALSDIEDEMGYSKGCYNGGTGCHMLPNRYFPNCYGVMSNGEPDPDTLP